MLNSPFFDSSSSGVGGWGDPKNDYQIYTGGFKDQIRVYPNPHHIRRNFSLFPFSNPDLLLPFAGDPAAPPSPAGLMINTTMTKDNVDYLVNSFEGDFFGFQEYAESTNVSLTFHYMFFGHPDPLHIGHSPWRTSHPRWVSVLQFWDPCSVRSFWLTKFRSDMTGFCSNGAVPPDCYSGTKWTPNDPVFFLHHGVRILSATSFTASRLSYYMVTQMVDKIWYDWQQKSIANQYAYGGGSLEATATFASFVQFPNGLPPYLSVSVSSDEFV